MKNVQISMEIQNDTPQNVLKRILRTNLQAKILILTLSIMILSFWAGIFGYKIYQKFYQIRIVFNSIMILGRAVIIYYTNDVTRMIIQFSTIIFHDNKGKQKRMDAVTYCAALFINVQELAEILNHLVTMEATLGQFRWTNPMWQGICI